MGADLKLYLPVKRANTVGIFGIGSIVTIRNGVSGVVCGLPRWEETSVSYSQRQAGNPISTVIENNLRQNSFSNPRVSKLLGTELLVQPPTVANIEDQKKYAWLIPAARFPLLEYCTNRKCQKVSHNVPSNGNKVKCESLGCTGKAYLKQLPIFLACQKGHLQDLDLVSIAHSNVPSSCRLTDIIYEAKEEVKNPNIRCAKCGANSRLKDWLYGQDAEEAQNTRISIRCGGYSPWINGTQAEKCDAEMSVQTQTSTQAYFPKTFSSLFIPQSNGVSDTLLDWIGKKADENLTSRGLIQKGMGGALIEECRKFFDGITQKELDDHIEIYNRPSTLDPEDFETAALQQEREEVESLRSPNNKSDKYAIVSPLEKEEIELNVIDADFHFLISKIVAVHRVSEDKVFLGFTRNTPPAYGDYKPNLKQINPFYSAAGNNNKNYSNLHWLPATRSYGEGIYLELDQSLLSNESLQRIGERSDKDISGKLVSPQFKFAHTLAHALIAEAALQSGYSTSSITEKIYDVSLASGKKVTAIFIYTSSATDSGTLGGLVELASGGDGTLNKIIGNALNKIQWCSLDPVCIHHKGACHHCVLLPETSCQYRNQGLDRKLIIG